MTIIGYVARSHLNWLAGLVILGLAPASDVMAQSQPEEPRRLFQNPQPLPDSGRPDSLFRSGLPKTSLKAMLKPLRSEPLRPIVSAPVQSHERFLDLNIAYTKGEIFNPTTGSFDPVNLRSYQPNGGAGPGVNAAYLAPMIEAHPGETIRITLHNNLPADPNCFDKTIPINTPHCFNGTNLHSHGLWVSPTGNSDNVLLSINPGISFQYEYNVPEDHPSGTFWYHPHRHGSTALQVGSGMAGALIVRGNRDPILEPNGSVKHGDIDTLLVDVRPVINAPQRNQYVPIAEKVLLFEQLPYVCVKPGEQVKYIDNDPAKGIDWSCNPGEVGVVESYAQFGPGDWANSGRYTSINGEVLPIFETQSGQLERWRLIHAGVRDTISFEIRKKTKTTGLLSQLRIKATEQAEFVKTECSGESVPYQVIAADGLTMNKAQKKITQVLQPGYRNDLLVAFPAPGDYCVVNISAPAAGSVSGSQTGIATGSQVMGFVHVGGTSRVSDPDKFVLDKLTAAAARYSPAFLRRRIITDLNAGLRFDAFTPHPPITEQELVKGPDGKPKVEHLVFFIDTKTANTKFEVGTNLADVQPYDPARIDRKLALGDAQAWELQSDFASHPFHIHVNSFEIIDIIDPNGKDVSLPDAVDNGGGAIDPQYPCLKGVWKDTIWVKSLIPPEALPKGVYTIHIRTRYQRYIGEFVLHCHILDHEDQGMMQNVSILLPDGQGGVTSGHH
jgi:FtsP/CotA-like multicopper oxidase with cupredoxin domain